MLAIKQYLVIFIIFFIMLACETRPAASADSLEKHTKTVPAAKIRWVALQPLGVFNTALVSFADKEIREFYHFKVKILSAVPLPDMAWYPPRSRYRADSLLNFLKTLKPDSINYIMGFTGKDISCTKDNFPDWGIFGLGDMPGPTCVISIFRLKKDNPAPEKLRERFSKVLLHELGHNCGLDHCPTVGCLMEDANGTIVTVDKEKKELCPLCREKLKVLINQ